MSSSLADLQKERGFPHPSRKKKVLKFKRESTRFDSRFLRSKMSSFWVRFESVSRSKNG
jgi:hypothetical protein